MKLPKTVSKYCKKCKKYTQHTIALAKSRERSALKKGSIKRAKKRGRGVGFGNKGKYGSKGPMSKWKRYGVKPSKRQDLRFKCKECGKSVTGSKTIRTKRLEFK